MQRAPTRVHHFAAPSEYPCQSAQRERIETEEGKKKTILRWKNGIVDIHLTILLLLKYEKQRFYMGKQGKDKEMAWKLHLLYNHLYQSPDNEGKFYSHYHSLQTYHEPTANLSCKPISHTLISRGLQDMERVNIGTICQIHATQLMQ